MSELGELFVIRFVFFDAVGTILIPYPSVSEIYLDVGRQYGTRQHLEGLRLKVRAAFQKQEKQDESLGWATSEERETQRWRSIVSDSLDDVTDPERCFTDLYRFFGQPDAWKLDERLELWQSTLAQHGIGMGIASNFDDRLRGLLDWFPPLCRFNPVLISSECGWRKPSDRFYQIALERCGHRPEEVLFVGDHPHYDVERPRLHGMKALPIHEFARDPIAAIRPQDELMVARDTWAGPNGPGGPTRLAAVSSH